MLEDSYQENREKINAQKLILFAIKFFMKIIFL